MAEIQTLPTRTADDIYAEIHHLMNLYPPLVNDRHRVTVDVTDDGEVTVKGYVKAAPTADYLLNGITTVESVTAINADELYVDEIIRRDVGKVVPTGVQVRVEYGAAILTGDAPTTVSAEALVKTVALVPGVHRVVTSFS
jgi:osmotically-inducible protein OsmY